jgi:hypothetical protein
MSADSRVKPIAEIETAHLFDVAVDLSPALDFGVGPLGRRVFYGAAGGSFEGERIRGEVLAGGGHTGDRHGTRHMMAIRSASSGRKATPACGR